MKKISNDLPFCTFTAVRIWSKMTEFPVCSRDEAVHTVTQALLSTVPCHLLSCGALMRKQWDEGKMVLRLTPEKVKVKPQDNKWGHNASVFYYMLHIYTVSLFIDGPSDPIFQLWDLAPLAQPRLWSRCPPEELMRVNEHHVQVDCHALPMTGLQKWPFNLLTRLRERQLCPSETRGYKRISKWSQTSSGSNKTWPWLNQPQAIKWTMFTYWLCWHRRISNVPVSDISEKFWVDSIAPKWNHSSSSSRTNTIFC